MNYIGKFVGLGSRKGSETGTNEVKSRNKPVMKKAKTNKPPKPHLGGTQRIVTLPNKVHLGMALFSLLLKIDCYVC